MQEQHERWMGIDFGLARIGLAVSDPLGLLASGIETIRWNGRDLSWAFERIISLMAQYGVTGVVLGAPNRTDGQAGSLSVQVQELADQIRARTGAPVILRDERYTTVIAARLLRESGMKSRKHRSVIDQVAAEILLQEHLESRRKADT